MQNAIAVNGILCTAQMVEGICKMRLFASKLNIYCQLFNSR